jgi:serine/threonine protein kinase
VNTESGGLEEVRGAERKSWPHETRICSVCGEKYFASADGGFCPVCILRAAAAEETGVVECFSAPAVKPRSQLLARRFEHYELAKGDDETPLELGRGAMGVTYKAMDVDLRCPVALKVINERYLEDESARLRFLREARAAASVRHPNVASVLHLGRTGNGYFYAMEFVEGETLENLIRRLGRLKVKLTLEITAQVAAGLAAVHKQQLVHRDIKPGNIIVSLEEAGAVIAKIIDLGLAKTVNEPGTQSAISTPGAFVGTPDFASPEQFAGVGVDIRSDLYSLGSTLWAMLTGRAPFRGAPSEVMHQHQHAPLPLEQLEDLPPPIIALIEVLLEKNPARRFQSPTELLKAMPSITAAIDAGRKMTPECLLQTSPTASRAAPRRPPPRPGPKKISVARLPVTGSDVFGREEDIVFLNEAWAKRSVNIVTIVAWGGVGKSTLVNLWLRRMAAESYRSAQLVFGWSFYRQGTSGGTSSADEFLDAALSWFGDPDPRIGTAWEKGERLAKLAAHRRTLLVLDGLEPLQNPPGPQEGRVRDPSLQALLRELAAFNTGLCVITTRTPVADIADHEGTSALRRDLEQLSNDAGAKLLRALGVKGHEAELRTASEEFAGHCLALTLLGSYLTDAYNGDIRHRKEVSEHLAHDVRQGAQARKVMESYQTWFGEGPEVSVLRMLGLFDRPVEEKALSTLREPPAIRGLTESLTDLSPTEWRTILARLRRTRLLAGEDPHNRGYVDTHPLVREYFGEQLRSQRTKAWKEGNRRLYHYYRTLAPQLPDTLRDMEPLFLAAIFGCNAGLFRDALHKVYIPRIQRGNQSFAANVLGARGALLSVLALFFEHGHWGSPLARSSEEQSLSAEDQLFILMQAGLYLSATQGLATRKGQILCARAECLCHLLHRPVQLYSSLMGQWLYSLMTDKLATTMQIAKRVYSLAQEQNDAALTIGAYSALVSTSYYSGDFESTRHYAMLGVELGRSGSVRTDIEEVIAPRVSCLCYEAMSEWHFGEIASCPATIAHAISLAKELNDMQGLVLAVYFSACLAQLEDNPVEVERLASGFIELSTRQNVGTWLPHGGILRGWARTASGSIGEGISWIEDGIGDYRAAGAILAMPFFLALKANALHRANRAPEALEAINEAGILVGRFGNRYWSAELHRLRGVLLTALGAGKTEIETEFCAAISTAKRQRSTSLAKRAEASYEEYRGQKGG